MRERAVPVDLWVSVLDETLLDTPVVNRPGVAVLASRDWTLRRVFEIAAAQLVPDRSLPPRMSRIAFGDGVSSTGQVVFAEIAVPDQDGLVSWIWDWQEITVGDLERAGERGTIYGNWAQPTIVWIGDIGDWQISWNEIVASWDAAEPVLDDILRVTGAFGLTVGASKTLRRAASTIKTHSARWMERGGTPDNVRRLLGTQRWAIAELASSLDISEAEAKELAMAFGAHTTADEPDSDTLRCALGELADLIEIVCHEGPPDTNRIRTALEPNSTARRWWRPSRRGNPTQ